MDHDDDDGVGYVAESHYLKGPSEADQQAMALLKLPGREKSEDSISSNVSDLDIPIYSSENLTTRRGGSPPGPAKNGLETSETSNGKTTTTSKNEVGFTGKLAFAIAASAIGSSFQHGYNTGVTNNAEVILKQWMTDVVGNKTSEIPTHAKITTLWVVTVSIFCVGGLIGGAVTGIVSDKLGRKGGLLWNTILVIVSVVCSYCAKPLGSIETLMISRFFIGINSGLNAGVAPMYLAEIAPVNLRGAIGTVYQLIITISILLAQIFGISALLGTENLWPKLFAITIIPAIFQLVTLPFCPESPKHLLLSKGDENGAEKALVWLRGTRDVHDEMDSMKAECDAIKLMPKVTIRELLTNNALRIPLIIALTIMCAQQLSGINAVMFYSTDIFTSAGLSKAMASYATLATGAINVLMTVVSLFLVEKAGRKTLLLVGFGGMSVITTLLMITLLLKDLASVVRYFCIIFMLIYIIMFAIGPGSIPWFLVSELFNQSARPTATSLAVCTNWTTNFLVGLAFPLIKDAIGAYVFMIFVILDCFFLWFIYRKVPETKNKSIEEISAMFRQQSYK